MPIFWRAYEQSALKGLKINYIIRVKGGVKVLYRGEWAKLNTFRFEGNARRRSLGRIEYCQRSRRRLWVTISRARDRMGKWGIWYLVSNLPLRAEQAAKEYGFRFDREEGFRDLKWDLGFSESRVRQIDAWSRLFTLFAIALMALTTLGTQLLVRGGAQARKLLRRVASRRRDRCELSLVAAVIALVQQDKTLFARCRQRRNSNLTMFYEKCPDIRSSFMSPLHSNSSLRSTLLAYYSLVDSESIDEVLNLFSEDATYMRCESFYNGIAEIERFYRNERKIRGSHDVKNLWVVGRVGIVEGTFSGKGADGQPKQIGFADFFTFNQEGKISDRHTYLQLGSGYVKE